MPRPEASSSGDQSGDRPQPPRQHTSRRRFDPLDFSLAGHPGQSGPPPPYAVMGNSYVDPEYGQYNPHHGQQPQGPVWGVARPLPRIVRPGMRRGHPYGTEAYAPPEQGPTSAIPQVKEIPTRNNRDEPECSPAKTSKNRRRLDRLIGKGQHRTDSHRGIPNALQRSISTDAGLRHYSGLQHAASEIDDALKTDYFASRIVTERDGDFDLRPHELLEGLSTGRTSVDRPEDSISEEDSAVDRAREKLDQLSNSTSQTSDAGKPPPDFDTEPMYQHPRPNEIRPNAPNDDEMFLNKWAKYRHMGKEFLAEWLGTTTGMTIGLSGSMVRTIAPNIYGNALTSSLGWGFGMMLGVYIAGGISGAHLNPCISIVLSIYRGFPWKQCSVYIVAQVVGAFTAAAICFGLYHDAILHFEGGLFTGESGTVFFTQPKDWVSPPTAFWNEFVATSILTGAVLALGDDSNAPAGAGMGAFIIGVLVTVLILAFGFQTGGCFNPARDLGPRLVALAAGYGRETFTSGGWWWIWGPWGADISGAIFGGAMYDIFIFVGGESPINYPPRRRKRAVKKFEIRWFRRLGGAKTAKMKDLEAQAAAGVD